MGWSERGVRQEEKREREGEREREGKREGEKRVNIYPQPTQPNPTNQPTNNETPSVCGAMWVMRQGVGWWWWWWWWCGGVYGSGGGDVKSYLHSPNPFTNQPTNHTTHSNERTGKARTSTYNTADKHKVHPHTCGITHTTHHTHHTTHMRAATKHKPNQTEPNQTEPNRVKQGRT